MTSALSEKFGNMVSRGSGIRRVTSDSKTGRQFLSQNKGYNFANAQPHIGKKQQERQIRQHQRNLERQAKKALQQI